MLEQLYNDFSTKIAPKIAEGFTMTKDYFFDLFGRYVKYLLVVDTIYLVWALVALITVIVVLVKYSRPVMEYSEKDNNPAIIFMYAIALTVAIPSVLSIFYRVESLAKTIFVPEVRVLEVINDYKHNNNL